MPYGSSIPKGYGADDGEMRRLFKHSGWEDIDSVVYGEDDHGLDCKWYGATASKYVLWDESADTWYFGVDDTGIDVKFFGATTGAYLMWDESADRVLVVGTSSRAISGEEYLMNMTYGGTCSSGDSMVALNINVTPSGANASWVSGIFANVTEGATKHVDGYISAGEFQVTNSCATWSAAACLVLDWVNNSTAQESQAYIMLRDYGTTHCRALFDFGTEWGSLIGSDGDVASLLAANVATASTHTIRITINAVPYFIMLSVLCFSASRNDCCSWRPLQECGATLPNSGYFVN